MPKLYTAVVNGAASLGRTFPTGGVSDVVILTHSLKVSSDSWIEFENKYNKLLIKRSMIQQNWSIVSMGLLISP